MKYAAELFGTFVLVFAGLTTAVIAGAKVGNVGVAMAFGLSLLAMAFAVGPISGCHINPAVTLGMLVSGRMAVRWLPWQELPTVLATTRRQAIQWLPRLWRRWFLPPFLCFQFSGPPAIAA